MDEILPLHSKYDLLGSQNQTTLPNINVANKLSDSGVIVPYAGDKYESQDADIRLRALELKSSGMEQTTKAIIEEMVRIQNEHRLARQDFDDRLGEERNLRSKMEQSVRLSQDLINSLTNRLKNSENKVEHERQHVAEVASYARQMEQRVVGLTQDLNQYRESSDRKTTELKLDSDDFRRGKDGLEHAVVGLVNQFRQLKARSELQGSEFLSLGNELKTKLNKLEDDEKNNMENARLATDEKSQTDLAMVTLKGSMEQRLAELRNTVGELQTRENKLEHDLRTGDQRHTTKAQELSNQVALSAKHLSDMAQRVESLRRDVTRTGDTNKSNSEEQYSALTRNMSTRVHTLETRLQDNVDTKLMALEQGIKKEREMRLDYEQESKGDADRFWADTKRLVSSESAYLKRQQKDLKTKTADSLNKLNDGMGLLEKQVEEELKRLRNAVKAEIKSRSLHSKSQTNTIDELSMKLKVSLTTMQDAVDGLQSQISEVRSESIRLATDSRDEANAVGTRGLADLDGRLLELKSRFNQIENEVDLQLSKMTEQNSDQSRNSMKAIQMWQNVTAQELQQTKDAFQRLKPEVSNLASRIETISVESRARLDSDQVNRIRDIDSLRLELRTRMESLATLSKVKQIESDVETNRRYVKRTLDDVTKLYHSLDGYKVSNDERVRNEITERIQGMVEIRESLERVRGLIEIYHQTPEFNDAEYPQPADSPSGQYSLASLRHSPLDDADSRINRKSPQGNVVSERHSSVDVHNLDFDGLSEIGSANRTPDRRSPHANDKTDAPQSKPPSASNDNRETPKDKTESPKDKPVTPENKQESLSDKLEPSKDEPATPEEKRDTPKDKPSTPDDKPSTPKDKTSTPDDKPSTPKDKPSTPDDTPEKS